MSDQPDSKHAPSLTVDINEFARERRFEADIVLKERESQADADSRRRNEDADAQLRRQMDKVKFSFEILVLTGVLIGLTTYLIYGSPDDKRWAMALVACIVYRVLAGMTGRKG